MLFLCPRAKKVWQNLGLDLKIMEACATDLAGQAVLEYLLCSEKPTVPNLGQTITADTYAVTPLVFIVGKETGGEWRTSSARETIGDGDQLAHSKLSSSAYPSCETKEGNLE
jgi:hypothetical protein